MNKVRRATHAGSWYERDPKKLDEQLSAWLKAVNVKKIPRPPLSVIEVDEPGWKDVSKDTLTLPIAGCKAIIAPHAGLSYSGAAAAYAYKCIDPAKFKRVFILGPSHKAYYDGCLLSRCDEYDTPLGELPLDKETIKLLRKSNAFLDDVPHHIEESEHSLELHLPYIRKVFQDKDIQIVPIIVGAISTAKEAKMGQILAPYLADESTLFVISSDFCHWGERFSYTPYQPNLQTKMRHLTSKDAMTLAKPAIHTSIRALDGTAIRHLTFPSSLPIPLSSNQSSDENNEISNPMERTAKEATKEFGAYLKETENSICGRHPIGVLMGALAALEEKGTRSELRFTRYEQSSKCVSVHDSSVSYASAFVHFI